MEAFLIAATPPTLTALLAALAVWVRQRGRHHQTRQTLDEAKDRIAVISTWLDVHRQLAPSPGDDDARRRALQDLEEAYDLITRSEAQSRTEQEESRMTPLLKSVFLWDARPSTTAARVVRILYYVSFGWVVLWLAAAVLFGLAIAFVDTGESFAYRLGSSVGITVLSLCIGVVPALVLRLVYQATAR